MESLKELFDEYSRSTRLQPALLLVLPVLITLFVWTPSVYGFGGTIFGLAVGCGFFALVVHFTRSRGRAAEKRLYQRWGGKPTTAWLRHSDTNLNTHTKARYCTFLAQHVNGWIVPTPEDELRDTAEADARYESAVVWLLEYGRDRKRFPLVFKENVSYGFRRNLYGLKPFGIALSIASTGLNGIGLYLAGTSATTIQISSLLISIAFVAIWLLVINPNWVRDAANGYARALLACCDTAIT
jgi:hypothetical protein